MSNVLELLVSYFVFFYDNKPMTRMFRDIVELAKSDGIKAKTLEIRRLLANCGDMNTPIEQCTNYKKEADKKKKSLPSFLPSVVCQHGKKREHIVSILPFSGFDVDHISEERVVEIMGILANDPHVLFASPSCSRHGIHFLILHDAADWLNEKWDGKDVAPFEFVWTQARNYAENLIGEKVDEACKNPERIFAISYDELLYTNQQPVPLHIDTSGFVPRMVINRSGNKSNVTTSVASGTYSASVIEVETSIRATLDKSNCFFASGNRNNYVHRFALLCNDYGVPQFETEDYCLFNFVESDFPAQEVENAVRSAYSKASSHGTLPAKTAIPSVVRSNENGGNIATFATIDTTPVSDGMAEMAVAEQILPTFSDKLNYDDLPPILQKVSDNHDSTIHRDKMLLGSIVTFSGLMGYANYYEGERAGIYGIYGGSRVYTPLYAVIYGNASSGKGDVKYCSYLASDIRKEVVGSYMQEIEDYQEKLRLWEAENKGKNKSSTPAPKEPEYRDVFIPGNSSSAAYTLHLYANGGAGISLETEGDTITLMLTSDFGNYSDMWRKGFHHEPISISRRTEKLHVEIEDPRLAILITETPGQLNSMFSGSWENGLGSRFIFYYLPNDNLEFHDVFAHTERTFEDIYKDLGREFTPLYHALQMRKGHPLHFVFSKRQQKDFLDYFQGTLKEKFALLGNGIEAVVFRFGLILFRIAMVLTALRRLGEARPFEDKPIFEDAESALICDDRDYHTAMVIVEALIEHSARVFSVLNKELDNPFATQGIQLSQEEIKLFRALPDSMFETKDFIATAATMGIAERTAERMLGEMCSRKQIIVRIRRGVYCKVQTSQQ